MSALRLGLPKDLNVCVCSEWGSCELGYVCLSDYGSLRAHRDFLGRDAFLLLTGLLAAGLDLLSDWVSLKAGLCFPSNWGYLSQGCVPHPA